MLAQCVYSHLVDLAPCLSKLVRYLAAEGSEFAEGGVDDLDHAIRLEVELTHLCLERRDIMSERLHRRMVASRWAERQCARSWRWE